MTGKSLSKEEIRDRIDAIEDEIETLDSSIAELRQEARGHYEQLTELTGCDCFAMRIACEGHDRKPGLLESTWDEPDTD